MSIPRDLIAAVRRLDEAELRRLLILARGLLTTSEGPVISLEDVPGMPAVTYRQRSVRCGRDCSACPHGPYWYARWTEDGRRRSQYIGRELPADVRRLLADADRAAPDSPAPDSPDGDSPDGDSPDGVTRDRQDTLRVV